MNKSFLILILTFFIAGCSNDTADERHETQPKPEPTREVIANKSATNGANSNTSAQVNQSVQSKNTSITIANGQTITSSETGVSYTVQNTAPGNTKSKAKH